MAFFAALLGLVIAAVSACSSNSDCGSNSYNFCCQNAVPLFNGSRGGACIDTRYQQCCAFTACYSNYQSCCNDTCCNSIESCVTNYTFDGNFDVCSSIENRDMRRGFVTIGFPIMFCVASVFATIGSIVLLFVVRVRWTAIAILQLITAVFVVIFSFFLLVSPLVFPMFFVSAAGIAAIVALGATRPPQRPEAVIAIVIAITAYSFLIMINPFSANAVFSAGPSYGPVGGGGSPGGVLGTLLSYLSEYDVALAPEVPTISTSVFSSCTTFYLGFFRTDPNLYLDYRIHDQFVSNLPWGLCARGYITWQLFNGVMVTILLPFLLILLVARLWEVRQAQDEAVEYDPRPPATVAPA